MTYLLDSSVLIDVLNGRNGRPELLAQFSQRGILLACCAVNVTEIYMGVRPAEEARTGKFLRSLEFYEITWEVARLAGDLFRQWRRKGQTLGLADVTVAAVALTHKLVLVTDNRKHFPMPELQVLSLPSPSDVE
jgi:predicted nucleic acid-binding protein